MKSKWYHRLKLKQRFVILTTLILIGTLVPLAIVIYKTQRDRIVGDREEEMRNHLQDMTDLLDLQLKEKQIQVNSALKVANSVFYESGEPLNIIDSVTLNYTAINQMSKEAKSVELPQWEVAGSPVLEHFALVDQIQKLTGQTATIFQKIDDGYLRISTNVRKLNGERATGTFIPNSSPVVQTIENGKTYRGRAFVVDDWYLTAYEPIKYQGQIVGILYVGVKEKDMNFLKEKFKKKQYYDSGYPYLLTKEGKLLIHPYAEGQNVSEVSCINQMQNMDAGSIFCEWGSEEDQLMLHFFMHHDFLNMTLGIAVPKKAIVDDPLNELSYIIGGGFVLTIVTLFVLISYFAGRQLAPLKVITEQLDNLANRKKVQANSFKRRDEIGLINDSLNQVIESQNQISTFAQAIGHQKFDVDFSSMGEEDELGNALIGMKESLRKASIEENQRAWVNEGLQKVTELIRNNQDSVLQMCNVLLPAIIRYMQANQGGLFIYNDEGGDEYLNLMATFAWDRQKHIESKISLKDPTSQGLIGQCYFEKKQIILKEVPEDFVRITSGLGGANPTFIIILPMVYREKIYGVIEIASFKKLEDNLIEFLQQSCQSMAAAIASLKITESTETLLAETQEKGSAIAAMEEELRQNLEEMQATNESMVRKEKEYQERIAELEALLGEKEIL